jgi:hypothetical protein
VRLRALDSSHTNLCILSCFVSLCEARQYGGLGVTLGGLKTDNTKLTSLIDRFGLPIVAALLLAGHFAPWAAHKTAALTLSAHELAVFTHFTPGAGIFLNQWFNLPIWAVALLGAVLAGVIGWWLNRAIAGLVCVGLASLGLPGYPELLTAYKVPDYQLQFYVSVVMMAAVALLTLLQVGRRPLVRAWAAATLPLVGLVPLTGYLMVKPAIETLYNDSLGVGLGWWLTLLGVLLALGMLVIMLLNQRTGAVPATSPRQNA